MIPQISCPCLIPSTVDKAEGLCCLVCRDDAGHLVRTEVMGLKEITHRVRAKHLWEVRFGVLYI